MLEANVGVASQPGEAEVVLLNVGALEAQVELTADGDVAADAVGPDGLSKLGPGVEENLCSGLVLDVLATDLEVGFGAGGLGSGVSEELEALGCVEFLYIYKWMPISYLNVVLDLVGGGAVLLDHSLV